MCFSFGLDAAAPQEYAQTVEEEDEESPNYEEKAQEIVQSILQEVVNTVAGGEQDTDSASRLTALHTITFFSLASAAVLAAPC